MRDGKTHKLMGSSKAGGPEQFFERHTVKLTSISGDSAGTELELSSSRTVLGRGPGVDIAIPDDAASRQHAVLEYLDDGFRIRDLGSTNGLIVNDHPCEECELGHGDRFEIGNHCYQLSVETREIAPETYVLSVEG